MVKEDAKAWARLIFTWRNGVSVLLLLHFIPLFINNLPHNAFTYKVDNLYLWYMNLTGQYQNGWGMYGTPTRQNDRFEIMVLNSQRPDQEYRILKIEGARELYLVEAMAFAGEPTQTHLARAYLKFKERDLGLKKDERIELHRYSATIVPRADGNDMPTMVWRLGPLEEESKEGPEEEPKEEPEEEPKEEKQTRQ